MPDFIDTHNHAGGTTLLELADFVVLAEDPHSIPVDRIKDIKIVRTVVGGKIVYEA